MTDDGTMPGRIIQVLDALTRGGPQSLSELTRETALPRSTTYRIAEDLRRRGVLVKTEDRYKLGPRVITWGCEASADYDMREAAASLLDELHQRSRNLVSLCRVDGEDIQLIDRSLGGTIHGAESCRLWPRNLRRAGLLFTAIGNASMVDQPNVVERLLSEGVPRTSPYSPQEARKIMDGLTKCLEVGFAIDNEGFLRGFSCVAASIRDASGGVVGAIAIIGRPGLFDPSKYATHVLAGAQTIGARLSASSQPAPQSLRQTHPTGTATRPGRILS